MCNTFADLRNEAFLPGSAQYVILGGMLRGAVLEKREVRDRQRKHGAKRGMIASLTETKTDPQEPSKCSPGTNDEPRQS